MSAERESAGGIAGVVQEVGYGCTASEAVFLQILNQFEAIDETALARVVGVMIRKQSAGDGQGAVQVAITSGTIYLRPQIIAASVTICLGNGSTCTVCVLGRPPILLSCRPD